MHSIDKAFLINKHGCPATNTKRKVVRHSIKHFYHNFGAVFDPYKFRRNKAQSPPLKPEMTSSGIFFGNRT